ncbi:aspartyl/glutamyl-tRNA amidotransferase B subunit [Candidatus Carsonella ruddii PV]|uniref:Aspartyl/glutamyl-tRNA amidotransferase B subunit n=1 Tax=Carsonella ruddii (strain PV) TaxID=387662 RepID=Q05FU8_CARRP|nr:aspartyl/glutamyl-tRNA amidotransferase B subunit [Candidatus Carsonella ruddii]BAF35073.1 aspartyl/glutamyl-tRNA amidotransferase B subunit [Candidatus Carsonella ruddii PV]
MFQFKNFLVLKIGIEIHVHLKTNKIFTNNKKNSYYDIAIPGILPYFNYLIKYLIVFFCFNLNSCFFNFSVFERKLYFYYDLPKNYQITQNVFQNIFNLLLNNYCEKKILIKKIHLEEDAASTKNFFLKNINYNRSGNSLIEIVTEPNFNNLNCLILFIKKINKIIKNYFISDCNMYNGNLRIDVNLSIINKFNLLKSKKTEIKNLNSYENILKSSFYEVKRLLLNLEFKKKTYFSTRNYIQNKTIKIRNSNLKNYNFDIDNDIGIMSYYNYEVIKKFNKKFRLKNIFNILPKKKYFFLKKIYFNKIYNTKNFSFFFFSKKNKIMNIFYYNFSIIFFLKNKKKKVLYYKFKKKIIKILKYFELINF